MGLHTVVLDSSYMEKHGAWLNRFVFRMPEYGPPFFHCYSYADSIGGLLEFEAMVKNPSGEKVHVLLPSACVVAILLDQSQKNPLGFVHQESNPEQ